MAGPSIDFMTFVFGAAPRRAWLERDLLRVLRAIVYGVIILESIKWLTSIDLIERANGRCTFDPKS